MQDRQPDAAYFEAQFSEEDPWEFESSAYEQTKYRRQNRVIADHIPEPSRILELGCAEGVHSELLLDMFDDATLTGVDISTTAIERARDRIPSDRANFVAGDLTDELDSLDGSFDVVVCSELIYYLGDSLSVTETHAFIKSVAELLESGGILCMANIYEQANGVEARLTQAPVLDAYKQLLSGEFDQVHQSRYSEEKTVSGSTHTYEIWGFEKNTGK